MSFSHTEGGIKATGPDHSTCVRLARFLNANGYTPAQYATAKAAMVTLANNTGATAQNRQFGLACAIVFDMFDVTAP